MPSNPAFSNIFSVILFNKRIILPEPQLLSELKYCTQLAIFVSDKMDHCLVPELNENITPIIVNLFI